MNNSILDASALLALLFQEKGGAIVADHLPGSILSAVNLSEVISKATERGMNLDITHRMLNEFPCEIVPFDGDLAYLAAALRMPTRLHGLSLGDRACLSLGMKCGWPVVTAGSTCE